MNTQPRIITLADVEAETVGWLWPGRIPRGKLSIIEGDPGLGKSTLALDLAARLTRCEPMPGESQGIHGGVVLLSAEDGLADTVRPRFDAAGGDPTWLHSFTVSTGREPDDLPTLPENVEQLAYVIDECRAELVVIDPLMAFLDRRTNSWRDNDVRRALSPVARVAQQTGAAILLIRHLTKAFGPPAIYRGGGSIGIIGAARSALLVAADPDDATRRVLASVKNNLAPRPASLAFRIEPHGASSRVCWLGESERTADDLVQQQEDVPHSEVDGALREVLECGPLDSQEVLRRMKQAGFSRPVVYRARNRLKIVADQRGQGGEKRSHWRLPGSVVSHSEIETTETTEMTETTENAHVSQ